MFSMAWSRHNQDSFSLLTESACPGKATQAQTMPVHAGRTGNSLHTADALFRPVPGQQLITAVHPVCCVAGHVPVFYFSPPGMCNGIRTGQM
jgi:hypothetical protein